MSAHVRYIIKPENLRSVVEGLKTGKTLDFLYTFLNIILHNSRSDPLYFNKNEELATVLFTETFPALIDYYISQRSYESILSIIPIYVHLCNFMSLLHKFSFIPFLSHFFSITKSLTSDYYYNCYIDCQYQMKHIKKNVNLNIFQRFLIDQLVKQRIIEELINDFLTHQSFYECSGYFTVFNNVFPFVEKTVLLKYENEFSRYLYSIDDPRFDDPVSIQLTKALSECSTKYVQFHFDNLVKFLMSESNEDAKIELIEFIQNTESLKIIQNSLLEMLDFILASMRDDEKKLREFSSILISNKICEMNFLIEKIGNDLFYNLAFFDLFKENYTVEFVDSVMNSEDFCEKTVEFGFRIIEYKIELIQNLSTFLSKSYSHFWNEERMNDIVSMSKKDKNRKSLLDSIKNFEIKNLNGFKIVTEILILLKPSIDEFCYESFADKILYYTDSIFIVPFLSANSFIPINTIDVEELISFSIFNEKLSNFLFDHFSLEMLKSHIDFLLDLQIGDEIENKCLAIFLFNLFNKLNRDIQFSCLIWDAVIRGQDEIEEVHSLAQRLINDNPEKCQNEVFMKIEEGNSKSFINFDFSTFSESSSEENGNYLFFGKPLLVSSESFFYLPSKIGHALNHSEPIEKVELQELFEFQIGDIGIDATILNMALEASIKLDIEFPMIQQSLEIAFQLKYKSFVDKLFQYIVNHSNADVQIDDELINSFSKFDENYAIELIKRKSVIPPVLNLFFIKHQNCEALQILRRIEYKIPIEILNHVVYSKSDFIEFCQSNRIDLNDVLPFVFSPNFPQFYRTKFVMHSIFQLFESNQQILLNFLCSQKKETNKKRYLYKVNFIPCVDSKFFSAYLAFALTVPEFEHFPKPKLSLFLASLLYSKEGEENEPLSLPIKEPADSASIQKVAASRALFYQFLDALMSELPYEVLHQFELIYTTKNSLSSSELKCFHDFSIFIYSTLISEELKKFNFFNQPKILMFKIQKNIEFQIEDNLFINNKKYSLSCIGTKSSVYLPHKIKNGNQAKFVKLSNEKKSYSDLIEGKIVFILYHLTDDDENEFKIIQRQFKKFRNCTYNFNKRAVICDSLSKAEIDWSNWKVGNELFQLAAFLLSEIGYAGLFKHLSTNSEFSEFFFRKSDWKEKYSIENIYNDLLNLASIYPRKEELIEILISSLKTKEKKHFSSIVLKSFDLNDECIEKVIVDISPSFDQFEDVILNYFVKQTTPNTLLQNDESLAKFVLSNIEKRFDSKIEGETIDSIELLPFYHLLSPMTDKLFSICMKTMSKKTITLILQSLGKSVSSILHSLTYLPHDEELASLFCGIELTGNEEEMKNDLKWIEFALSSDNYMIRNHCYKLIQLIFNSKSSENSKDLEKIGFYLKGAILRCLLSNYLNEVLDFIINIFGCEIIDSPEFVTMIYDEEFNCHSIPVSYQTIQVLYRNLSPPLSSSIIKWHYIIKNNEKDSTVFLVFAADYLYAAINCCFNPPFVGFFEDILTPLCLNISYKALHMYFELLDHKFKEKGIFECIKLAIEFDVIPYEYIQTIKNTMLKYDDFRETEIIILALILPSVVLKRKRLIEKDYKKQIAEKDLLVQAFETANLALSLITQKDSKLRGFIRKSGRNDIESIMTDYYHNSYLNFFLADLYTIIDYFVGTESKAARFTYEYQVSALKKIIKYITMSSLAFRDVLKIVFDMIFKAPGLRVFNKILQFIEFEWSELCCEVSREILSDIQFNIPENRKQAVTIIDRELCTQLYHFNSAEKGYLRFLIGIMKNDQIRVESKLQSNPQIFNVFRNEFVFCIDDVALFIDISLDKYKDDFFNEDDIKNFILKLKLSDNQIKQKLKIVLNLLEKSQNKMKCLIEEIFPKIEELSSSEGLDNELSELINKILEQALIILSLLEE